MESTKEYNRRIAEAARTPKRPRQEMKAQNEVLRARIAELEARLSLAEKVVEAAIWKVGDDGQTQCAICGRYNDSHEAYCVLADYRAKYKS